MSEMAKRVNIRHLLKYYRCVLGLYIYDPRIGYETVSDKSRA